MLALNNRSKHADASRYEVPHGSAVSCSASTVSTIAAITSYIDDGTQVLNN